MADDTDRILSKYGQPDDEHGMLFSRVGGELKFNPYEAIKKFMAYRAPPGALSTSGDDTPVRNAADAAGWVGLSGLGLNAFGAVPANALGSAGAKAPQALRAAAPPRVENPIRAYHGSPHDFDKFDLSKIGTGEGAQAYGHGLYFAESEPVARSYRDTLSPEMRANGRGFLADDLAELPVAAKHGIGWTRMLDRVKELGSVDAVKAELERAPNLIQGISKQRYLAALDEMKAMGLEPAPPGKMYEVAIHASPDQFLDWDKPLSQQSEAVRKLLESVRSDVPNEVVQGKNGRWYTTRNGHVVGEYDGHLSEAAARSSLRSMADIDAATVGDLMKRYDSDAVQNTAKLREQGIPGIRYLDQGSRGAGEGTSNYVVFDPERIEILRKYGLLGPVAGLSTAEILQRYGQDERE